jgi:hypothetical protein
MDLWKSVENFSGLRMARVAGRASLSPEMGGEPGTWQPPVRACSACAGDYEDPDRTAWMPDEEEEDLLVEKAQERAQEKAESGDEFPAREARAAGKEAMRCKG